MFSQIEAHAGATGELFTMAHQVASWQSLLLSIALLLLMH